MTGTPERLVVEPLTPEVWPLFQALVDEGGPAGRCWCMFPRIGAAYRRRPAEENRGDFRAVVEQGPPPGLLLHDGDQALGWCALTPRTAVPAVERAWRTRRVDDVDVWVISCFYVRKGHRRRGIASRLVEAAVERARSAGAPAVEAYPLDGALSPSATSTGYLTTFLAAGFTKVARRSPERAVVRLVLRG